jgi:hypothetical protein
MLTWLTGGLTGLATWHDATGWYRFGILFLIWALDLYPTARTEGGEKSSPARGTPARAPRWSTAVSSW